MRFCEGKRFPIALLRRLALLRARSHSGRALASHPESIFLRRKFLLSQEKGAK